MGSDGVLDDPFGLEAITVASARSRPGAKWSRVPDRLAAWVADMDFPVAPAIRERLIDRVERDLGYPAWPAVGRSYLPELFATRMSDRYGWTPPVAELRELVDVIQGLQLSIHHLTGPGDGIVLHMPAYHPFIDAIALAGRRRIDVPAVRTAQGWAFDHDDLAHRLEQEPARMLLLCNPQNPIGHVFTRQELEDLGELVLRHDLVVVSDEIHADFVHPGHTHVPFASLDGELAARTVTVTSASKAFNLAGMRWAIMHAGPARMRDELDGLPHHYLGAPNVLAVEATSAAWTESDDWQRAVLQRLDANRHLLGELLAERLPTVDYVPPDATYMAWLDLATLGWDDEEAELRARGVELSPGPQFGPQGEHFARLNFATSSTVLRAVVDAMATPPVT